MIKKFKDILCKIVMAQREHKKWINLYYKKSFRLILDVLWEEGLIYGYSKYSTTK